MNNSTNENGDAVTDGKTNAAVVADIVARHMKPERLEFESADDRLPPVDVMAVPKGIALHSVKKFLDEYRNAPERREGIAMLVELESLIQHANRFSDADSALFAQPHPTAPTLTAVLDYHRANTIPTEKGVPSGPQVIGEPRFGRHRAVYTFPVADEWTAWLAMNGKTMSQGDFASFLEDRVLDVADPNGAFTAAKAFAEAIGVPSFASPNRLLELSRGLTVHVDDRTTNKVNPSTGETTMHFESTHADSAGAPLVIPRAFLIQIPVFQQGTAYQLPVRLRYRAGGGKVLWSYEIHQAARAFNDAFRAACDEAAKHTGLPLFYGAPEAT